MTPRTCDHRTSARRKASSRPRIAVALALVVLSGSVPRAMAAPTELEESFEARHEQAQRLVQEAQDLQERDDPERALELYLRARALERRFSNTFGAANCLEALGRLDEALELYQEVVRDFSEILSAENRQNIGSAIAGLSEKTGALELTTNAANIAIVIDDNRESRVRSGQRIRLMPGAHSIEVTSNGYYSRKLTVQIEPSKVESLNVELTPVGAVIRVHVAATPSAGVAPALARRVRVLLDGVSVGTAPWEGSVVPATHIVQLEGEGVGSAPTRVDAIVQKEQTIRLSLVPLSKVRLTVNRPDATLQFGDLKLGMGRWNGSLPVGAHILTASAPGFHHESIPLSVVAGKPSLVDIALQKNPDDTFWEDFGFLWVGAVAGPSLAPTMNSGPEEECPDECTGHSGAFGMMGALRVGYTWPNGFSLDGEAGGMWIRTSFSRAETANFSAAGKTVTATYSLRDSLSLWGPFAGLGLGYGLLKHGAFDLAVRAGVDVVFANAYDRIDGTISSGGVTAAIDPGGFSGAPFLPPDSQKGVDFFASAEATARLKVGNWRFGAGLAASMFLLGDLELGIGQPIAVDASAQCQNAGPESAFCAPGTDILSHERAYGRFVAFSPRLTMQYELR
ncbi:tetratricopeptide repeat protein [Polyangium spumosum]|uniref:PEGA domain-containing protein n=1 Tax=Polyangium spumosum TaxID=889282 RepID=A0A6N7Q2J1_9BACT|nr:tetratricopeptide repeat protein [Polyangium spumosum]MRG98493.1 hypothetical protein [Polyangium spumosum]